MGTARKSTSKTNPPAAIKLAISDPDMVTSLPNSCLYRAA
jgi:hypothetical protein